MNLYTPAQLKQLIANGAAATKGDEGFDPTPVVKLFTPFGGATWLLTEVDPENHRLAFGLADLGLGCPELGYVCLSELEGIRCPFGLGVERDLYFEAKYPLSVYAEMARNNSRIVA